jgi:hypothetical protein
MFLDIAVLQLETGEWNFVLKKKVVIFELESTVVENNVCSVVKKVWKFVKISSYILYYKYSTLFPHTAAQLFTLQVIIFTLGHSTIV